MLFYATMQYSVIKYAVIYRVVKLLGLSHVETKNYFQKIKYKVKINEPGESEKQSDTAVRYQLKADCK